MTVFRNLVKFSVILLLPVILNYSTAQNCAFPELHTPLTITSSPGFLSGAITFVGNQECTASGVCRNIPLICPVTSCCISTANNFPVNISLPSSPSQSKCGCWDSRRKSCQPVSSFQIAYSSCDSKNGGNIQRKFQILHGSREMMSKICKSVRAEVQLVVGSDGNGIYLRIKTLGCTQQSQRIGQQLIDKETATIDDAAKQLSGALTGNRGRDMLKTFAAFISQKNKIPFNLTQFSNLNDLPEMKAPLQCVGNPDNDSFTMSSNFLSGAINNFLSLNTGICSGQGTCKISTPKCQSTSCCLVPLSGDANSSGDLCECLPSGLNVGEDVSNSCLAHHKVYKVFTSLCTETGERVQRSLSVRIPSNDFNRCISDGKSWEKASTKFEVNENGNLEAIIEIQKCILSGANTEFLEIEEVIKAELNVDIVFQLVKQIQ